MYSTLLYTCSHHQRHRRLYVNIPCKYLYTYSLFLFFFFSFPRCLKTNAHRFFESQPRIFPRRGNDLIFSPRSPFILRMGFLKNPAHDDNVFENSEKRIPRANAMPQLTSAGRFISRPPQSINDSYKCYGYTVMFKYMTQVYYVLYKQLNSTTVLVTL